MVFICYPKCSTCQRAKAFLDEHGISYELRDIKTDRPTADELKQWHKASGLPLRRFFNTSGMLYRQMDLKNKLNDMTEDEMYNLLSSDGMLVKRPIAVYGDIILIGFHPSEWTKHLL